MNSRINMVQKEQKDKIILNAKVRDIFGKHNRSLRKSGGIPANIFGKDFTSQSIVMDQREFTDTFKIAGETNVIYIKVDEKEIPTLISEIQIHPLTQSVLHVDLRKINLKQKIETQVPISIVGTSSAVEELHGILLTLTTEITIESLPADIPDKIEIDISKLKEIGEAIHISDLPKSEVYEIKDEPEKMIVSVTEHKEEVLEPETVSEEPEILTEVAKETTGEEETPDAQTNEKTRSSDEKKKE